MKAFYVVLIFGVFSISSCRQEIYVLDESLEGGVESDVGIEPGDNLADWGVQSHSNDGEIDYDKVFDQSKVQRIDVVISSDEYSQMETDLANLKNSSGDKPVYVPCDFYYEGKQWYEVGFRYKGNSSLNNVVRAGIEKLPFRLKFDKFEDEFPAIKNQRFYGFKDLSLCSNYKDASFMHEKVATALFREFGVPAVETAYYELYVDVDGDAANSNAPVFYGLYTLDEVVFDTMLMSVFGSNSGNCYKPEGSGAAFSATGFSLDHFEKKTNEETSDWSDIQALYDALHSTNRETNMEVWKNDLEAVFDVAGFLKYLAVNNTIENWDTYGNMTHNYYLYHDPEDDLIKWISWDNNLALNSDGRKPSVSLSMEEVSKDWPLISYIIAVDEYKDTYEGYLLEFTTNVFTNDRIQNIYDSWDAIIKPSAVKEVSPYSHLVNGIGSYESELSKIKNHVVERNTLVTSYLMK